MMIKACFATSLSGRTLFKMQNKLLPALCNTEQNLFPTDLLNFSFLFSLSICILFFLNFGGGGGGGAFSFFVAQSINEILYNNFPSKSTGKIKQHVVTLS